MLSIPSFGDTHTLNKELHSSVCLSLGFKEQQNIQKKSSMKLCRFFILVEYAITKRSELHHIWWRVIVPIVHRNRRENSIAVNVDSLISKSKLHVQHTEFSEFCHLVTPVLKGIVVSSIIQLLHCHIYPQIVLRS